MQNAIDRRGRAVPEARARGPWSAKAVANTLLQIATERAADIEPLKLQKLVYYAHGWSLALLGRPLIDEQVQAWKYGPVIPSIYHAFKRFGNGRISELTADFDDNGHPYTPILPVSAVDERKLLERIWDSYGKFSGVQLSNMTHAPETPWSKASDQNRDGLHYYAIDNGLIADYFKIKAAQQRAKWATTT